MNCRFCNRVIPQGMSYCSYCGNPVAQTQRKQDEYTYVPVSYMTQEDPANRAKSRPVYGAEAAARYASIEKRRRLESYANPVPGKPLRENCGMFEAYGYVLRHYCILGERARRREYWLFFAVNAMITALLGAAVAGTSFAGTDKLYGIAWDLFAVYSVFAAVPAFAATVRRLHDTGKRGVWLFIGLIPAAGPVILLVQLCADSEHNGNAYGACPKRIRQGWEAQQWML